MSKEIVVQDTLGGYPVSYEVVESKKQRFTLADFSAAFLTERDLVLDSSKPMPLDYSATWYANVDAVTSEDPSPEVATKWGQLLNLTPKQAWFHASESRENKRVLTRFGLICLFDTMALIPIGLATGSATLIIIASTVITIPSTLFSFKGLIKGSALTVTYHTVRSLLDTEYQNRVKDWALQRYGMRVDPVWLDSGDRPVEDMAYVGTKDGKRVYCYETPSGWVLGDLSGELPTVTQQQLAFA